MFRTVRTSLVAPIFLWLPSWVVLFKQENLLAANPFTGAESNPGHQLSNEVAASQSPGTLPDKAASAVEPPEVASADDDLIEFPNQRSNNLF